MTTSSMDQPPKMITITAGEEGDQIVIDIPEDSLRGLEKEKKKETVVALSRFIVALGGNGEFVEDDMAAVLSLDGMLMTLPGEQQPITMREMFGSMMITGSPENIADLQSGMQQ